MRLITDNKNIVIAAHGNFCTGCNSVNGNCGRLTREWQGFAAPPATNPLRSAYDLRVTVANRFRS